MNMTSPLERLDDLRVGVPVRIVRTDADQRHARPNRTKDGWRRARIAAVMSDLEHIRVQRILEVPQQPVLLWSLGVTRKEHRCAADVDEHHGACQVRIGQRSGPARIRRERR